jgi:hypothetical protein
MMLVSSCQTLNPTVIEDCPIPLLPAEEDPVLQAVPWTVVGEPEEDQNYVLDNEGFLIYSNNIETLIKYGREQKRQVLYYTVNIEECRD